jgi:hypothetical protein
MSDYNFNKEFQRTVANDKAKAAFMRRTRKLMASVVKMLQSAGLVIQDSHYMAICGNGDFNLSLTGNCRDRDLFVALMRRAKWTPAVEADPKGHYYWTKWTNPEAEATLGDVRLYITFSSNDCRRVQVGTKTVEQPVYETVCDDT